MSWRIVLLGPPGAGKGTQAKRMCGTYHVPHISTGDIFRSHVNRKTDLGIKIADCLAKGKLVSDSLACEVVAERLTQKDCRDGYILDGFPRTVTQAEALDHILANRGEALDVAIDIAVNDEDIVERLSARRSCPECGKIFNTKFGPMTKDGCCDEADCQDVTLIQRDDDREGTIRDRLGVYHEDTEPIVMYYDGVGLRRSVSGDKLSPDDVASKIEEILMDRGAR